MKVHVAVMESDTRKRKRDDAPKEKYREAEWYSGTEAEKRCIAWSYGAVPVECGLAGRGARHASVRPGRKDLWPKVFEEGGLDEEKSIADARKAGYSITSVGHRV